MSYAWVYTLALVLMAVIAAAVTVDLRRDPRRPADARMTFGYGRIEIVADAAWTVIEAIESAIMGTLAERFGVTHSSLEFDHADYAQLVTSPRRRGANRSTSALTAPLPVGSQTLAALVPFGLRHTHLGSGVALNAFQARLIQTRCDSGCAHIFGFSPAFG